MSTQLFKGGEEVYVQASKVQSYLANGYSVEPGGSSAEKKVFSSMKTADLKALLAEHEVEIPAGAKKADLVALAEEKLDITPDPDE